ncbi:unnamed protein product [Urochloa humidicola]
MVPWVEQWTEAGTDVHEPPPPYDESTYAAYLHWFHGATRWRCFPVLPDPEPHEANIIDTFATEPPAAFHVLTDICNDTGDELMSFADKLEASPPRVARAELISALRRLAVRAKDGVWRVSCFAMGDAAIPPAIV